MKPSVRFWSYLAQFALEWKMLKKKKVIEKIETHILC